MYAFSRSIYDDFYCCDSSFTPINIEENRNNLFLQVITTDKEQGINQHLPIVEIKTVFTFSKQI